MPAVAATPREQPRVERRRKAKANKLGRGYEYADLEPDSDDDGDHVSSGFVGVSLKTGTASGLKTLTGNGFDDGPHMPMMPSTWDADPPETR
ncbi:hypothetical protein A5657_09720 [Mycobacterium kubicae]|nr:hypothetical protein A5657_09720 [Mycobacterium kubicae]